MSLKPLVLAIGLIGSPASANTNLNSPTDVQEDRLCIIHYIDEVRQGNSIRVSGIMHCRGTEPIQGFEEESENCTIGNLNPAGFMREEIYTSCPFSNIPLEQS